MQHARSITRYQRSRSTEVAQLDLARSPCLPALFARIRSQKNTEYVGPSWILASSMSQRGTGLCMLHYQSAQSGCMSGYSVQRTLQAWFLLHEHSQICRSRNPVSPPGTSRQKLVPESLTWPFATIHSWGGWLSMHCQSLTMAPLCGSGGQSIPEDATT
jgi:hypothetical protein